MTNFLQDILAFISGYITHWQSYATGGVLTALISLIERLTGKTLSQKSNFIIFVIIFSVVAFFLTWRDEHLLNLILYKNNSDLTNKNGNLNAQNQELLISLAAKSQPIKLNLPETMLGTGQKPPLKKRANILSDSIIKFANEIDKDRPQFLPPHYPVNQTQQVLADFQKSWEQGANKAMQDSVVYSQESIGKYHLQFSVPIRIILGEIQAAGQEVSNSIAGYCEYANNTEVMRKCAEEIGVLANKLPDTF